MLESVASHGKAGEVGAGGGGGLWYTALSVDSSDGYAMLLSPNKSETAVHGRLCPCDIAVCIHDVLAKTWVGVPVSSLALKFVLKAKELERLI